MRIFVGALLAMWIAATALADAPSVRAGSTPADRAAETLKQIERDWAAAELAGDSDKIGRIVADDWIEVNNEGRKLTKVQLLKQIKSSKHETMSVAFGPMDVKIMGDVAVVQGSDVDTNTRGTEIWMDVFANRDGKWVAVRSQTGRVGMVSRPRWPI